MIFEYFRLEGTSENLQSNLLLGVELAVRSDQVNLKNLQEQSLCGPSGQPLLNHPGGENISPAVHISTYFC